MATMCSPYTTICCVNMDCGVSYIWIIADMHYGGQMQLFGLQDDGVQIGNYVGRTGGEALIKHPSDKCS